MLRKVIVIIGIILLTFSFTAGAAEKKDVKAQPPLCKEVTALIKSGEIKKDRYRFETVDIPDEPHSYEYVNIDIDRDGISDKVTISSGSVESLLVIQLSSGGEYELDEGLMRLVKLKGTDICSGNLLGQVSDRLETTWSPFV